MHGTRMVLFMNRGTWNAWVAEGSDGHAGDRETMASTAPRAGLRVTPYDIPAGCVAGYYPECNPLMPLSHHAEKSKVPAAKAIALTYQSSKDVSVETVSDPVLEQDDDVVLRVTATAICGSDLHIFRGKIPDMEAWGHPGARIHGRRRGNRPRRDKRLKKGDRVVVPFTIACGECFFCNKTLFAACETTNPGAAPSSTRRTCAPVPGSVRLLPPLWRLPGRPGGVCRVPKANVGPLVIPPGLARRAGAVPFGHPAHWLPGRRERRGRPGLDGGDLRRGSGGP
jgi:hypothetical protein